MANYVRSRVFTVVLSTMFLVFLGAGCTGKSGSDTPKQLVMCYLPNEASEEYAEFRGMIQDSMAKAVGIKIIEITVADYNAVVEAMRTKHADIVLFGPVSYVQAVERSGAEAMAIVAPFGDKSRSGYTSKIVVKAGSPIKSLGDLRGKSFAFVDPASTSGNYVPTLEFMNACPGTTNEDLHSNGKFFSSVSYSGKHQNGLMAVINGDVDAAPVSSDILAAEIVSGRVKESDITVIHESPRLPISPMTIRGDLPDAVKANVKKFLLSYKDPAYFHAMFGMKPENKPEFVEAFDHEYDYIRDLMTKVMPR